jgi:hypothetical protein
MNHLIFFTGEEATNPVEETITATTEVATEETVTATTEVATEEAVTSEAVNEETATGEILYEVEDSAPSFTEEGVHTLGADADGMNVLLSAEESVAETVATTEATATIAFQPKNFVDNLQYMGIGMLTIFIVIGAIILATTAINKIFSKKKD